MGSDAKVWRVAVLLGVPRGSPRGRLALLFADGGRVTVSHTRQTCPRVEQDGTRITCQYLCVEQNTTEVGPPKLSSICELGAATSRSRRKGWGQGREGQGSEGQGTGENTLTQGERGSPWTGIGVRRGVESMRMCGGTELEPQEAAFSVAVREMI